MLEAANSSLLEGADLNEYSYPDSNVSRVGNAYPKASKMVKRFDIFGLRNGCYNSRELCGY